MKAVLTSIYVVGFFLLGSFTFGASVPSTPIDSHIFVKLSKKVVPSVVNISTFASVQIPQMNGDDFFRYFFENFFEGGRGGRPTPPPPRGAPRGRSEPTQTGLGTGFIIDESGLILTNNHVVGDAELIKVRFTEDETEDPTPAEVIGRDPELDLALIQVKTKRKLQAMTLGDSDALEVGEYVVAVGNPFGRGHSVSHGIISAKERRVAIGMFSRYLQTDAPINPGNSGGPLVNLKGEVIGINNAIDARAQGIGFAIPINAVKRVLPQLRREGKVERGYIGVVIGDLTPEIAKNLGAPEGLKAPLVTAVPEGEPAEKAGILPYDIIVKVNGKTVSSRFDLIEAVTAISVGERAQVTVLRKGEEKTIDLVVAARPGAEQFASTNGQKNRPVPDEGSGKKSIDTGLSISKITPQLKRLFGLPEGVNGIVVTGVDHGSPGERSGLERGDLILEVNREKVNSTAQFLKIVREKKSYLLRVLRPSASGLDNYRVVVLDLKGD